MLMKNTINWEWNIWKDNFCQTYENKGWIPVKYAFSFKYIDGGTLLDYALKKERLLLEINKDMDNKILIDIRSAGLPDFVTNRINRQFLHKTEELFNELRSLEHLIKKNPIENKKESNQTTRDNNSRKKPCRTCGNMNKKNRYHLESACWFKNKESNIKSKNNHEIETELIEKTNSSTINQNKAFTK
uniref:Uncharacterized protein n=1 Tax=Clastoptera arizonana TaxID=38151 RepID=A0A1B6C4J8_9HEMI